MTARSHTDAAAVAARALGIALRTHRLYPAGAATRVAAVETALREIDAATVSGQLTFDVYPDGLRPLGASDDACIEPQLARVLHEHRIGQITFDSELDAGSLEDFLATLVAPEASPTAGATISDGSLRGIGGRQFDLEHLFRDAGESVGTGRPLWDRILDAFGEHRQETVPWERLGCDPELLEQMLGWVAETDDLREEMESFSRVDLLSMVVEQAGARSDAAADRTIQNLETTFRAVFDHFDPEIWLQFLGEPLPVQVGGREDVQVDLAVLATGSFTAVQIERLVRYGLETRTHATPRLFNLFRQLLSAGTPDQLSVIERTLPSDAAAGWPGFHQLATGEDVEPWVGRDYGLTLAQPLAMQGASAYRLALDGRRGEFAAGVARHAAARIAISLLCRDAYSERAEAAVPYVADRLDDLLESDDLELLEEGLAELSRREADQHAPTESRSVAEQALADWRSPDRVEHLLGCLAKAGEDRFPVLWRILDHLAVRVEDRLLDLVAAGVSGSHRHHIARLWRDASDLPVDAIVRRIEDSTGRSARSLTLLVVDIARTDLFPALQAALAHPEPEVRRIALNGLRRLPDAVALPPLLTALTDPTLEVRVAALQAVRKRDPEGCRQRVAAALTRGNRTGRHSATLVAALKAAEALEARDLLPLIDRLARPPILFRRRRRAVTFTAQRVAAALRRRTQGVPHAPSARAA